MKTRIIHTRFWQDNFILDLSPVSRLLFIYLITNERVGLTGGYECPDKIIKLETGLSEKQLKTAKEILSNKIIFQNGWIGLKNAIKYNDYSANKIHEVAYKKELDSLPEIIRKFILDKDYSPSSLRLDLNKKEEIIKQKEGECEREYKSILSLTDDVLKEIAKQKEISLKDAKKKREEIELYCKSHGKKYKDYRATILNWINRDLDSGKLKKIEKAKTWEPPVNPAGKQKLKEEKAKYNLYKPI